MPGQTPLPSEPSCLARTRDWWASSMRWWPITRSRPSPPCPASRRSGPLGSGSMRIWWTRACRCWGISPCRTPSRPSPRWSGKSRSKAKRTAPKANTRACTFSITARKSGALYEPVHQRLLPLDAAWQQGLGRNPLADKKLARGHAGRAPQPCWLSSASISSSRSSGRAPNPWRARTRAGWRRCSGPTRTSTNCLKALHHTFHRLRQSGIDEELFDVIAGFEALAKLEKR